jgi:hypothetical protein
MRTTIDLPEELFRQVKARADMEDVKLEDLIAACVQRGLGEPTQEPEAARRRSPLPYVSKAAASGKPILALSNAQVQIVPDEEDADRAGRLAGP